MLPTALLAGLLLTCVGSSIDARAQTTPAVRGASAISSEQVAAIARDLPADRALDSLHALYSSIGYLAPRIALGADTVTVDEGARYRLDSLRFLPDSVAALARLGGFDQSPFVGNPFSTARVGELLAAVVAALSSRGYPLASARVVALDIDDSNARVRPSITATLGERVTITSVTVEGNTETDEDLIIAAAAVRSGTPFSEELLGQVRARVERLGLFTEVAPPQLYGNDSGSFGILVTVTEGSSNTFDGILGYQPPEAAGEEGSLTGHLNFVLRNLFGSGRRFGVRFERSKPSQLLEVRYGEPYLFRLPLDVEIGFSQRQEIASFALPSYVQRSVTLAGSYGFLDAWSVRVGGAFEETLPELDTLRACESQLLNSSRLESSLGIAFDTRSNQINPTSGALLTTSVTVGSKSVRGSSVCADSLVGDGEFRQRIEADLDAYMSLGGAFVIAAGVHGGEVRGDLLEESDLFRVGGQSTVRGYREDEFRASRRAWGKLETRVLLSRGSYAALFVDGGYAHRPRDLFGLTEAQEYWLLGYGVAAQIESPLGLIQFSFALGLDDTFDTGKVFVGLVNRF